MAESEGASAATTALVVPHHVRMVRTSSGVEFNASSDHWAYRDGVNTVSLDFSSLSGCAASLLHGAKSTLAWYAEHRSPDHLLNMFHRLTHFMRAMADPNLVATSIQASTVLNYRATLDPHHQWFLASLSGLLKKWHALGHPGVEDDVPRLFRQLRLKGNARGTAVLTMDPYEGPFTQIESEAVQAALNDAYADGTIEQSDFVLVWLYVLLGQRNKQYAALKVRDVQVKHDADGIPMYSVMMPSAKRRTASPRDRRVERSLVEQFGAILFAYTQKVRESFMGLLEDPDDAPLFPGEKEENDVADFAFHQTAAVLGQRLTNVLHGLRVHSERTGNLMKMSAIRFRRTIGTRAGEEGYSPLVIAALLDHTDTQSVGVYTANSPAIIDRIDRALAMDIAPLAQAFAGVVQDPSGSAGVDPSKRIIDLRIDRGGASMGKCGSHGFCGFAAPIACYTCKSFSAWLDGPHEAVLQHLLDRREKLLQTSDKRMASVNDRTIFAVAAVIQQCNDIKSEMKVSIGG